ncbi:MAG: hypothetical protein KF740_19450 [Ramlibacter sp.]|nr:hypothetical protein [Ramlibacter sp.]
MPNLVLRSRFFDSSDFRVEYGYLEAVGDCMDAPHVLPFGGARTMPFVTCFDRHYEYHYTTNRRIDPAPVWSPPPENGKARSVAAPAAPGAEVSTLVTERALSPVGPVGSLAFDRADKPALSDSVADGRFDHKVRNPQCDDVSGNADHQQKDHQSVGVNAKSHSISSSVSSLDDGTRRLSNLDLLGRLVKRGCIVSWHGCRYRVTKVRLGYFWGRVQGIHGGDLAGPLAPFRDARLRCESVQVVP